MMSYYEDPRERPAEEKMISLDKIEMVRSLQGRERLDSHNLEALREAIRRGKRLPPRGGLWQRFFLLAGRRVPPCRSPQT
jgi:hypothetical protein